MLLTTLDTPLWGIGSLTINWIPGLVGVVQIAAHYRCQKASSYKIILYSCASLIFCPMIPSIILLYLLCKIPKNTNDIHSPKLQKEFGQLMVIVTMVRALEGCLESPLQLLYKMFLMFNGVIYFDFTSTSETVLKDLHGNGIPIPFVLNFVIGILTLLKGVLTLNLQTIIDHPTSTTKDKVLLFDFMMFLITTTLFKLGALIVLFGYFNILALAFLVLAILVGIYINSKTLGDQELIPRWLILFMSPFVTICFSTKKCQDLVKVQTKNLQFQTWGSCIVYGIGLIVLLFLVNFSVLHT